jgi:hypothetical protein
VSAKLQRGNHQSQDHPRKVPPTQEVIDANQAWFWTPEWQMGEREADANAIAREGEFFASADELLRGIERRIATRPTKANVEHYRMTPKSAQ